MSGLKKHPKLIQIEEYQYDLPDERIARFPLKKRDQSKLLIYQDGKIQESIYRSIPTLIPTESLLLFNQAKVIHARLYFRKESGGKLELFCLGPDERYPDITTAMNEENEVYWKCLVKGAHKWKDDSPIFLDVESTNKAGNLSFTATAEKVKKEDDYFVILFKWTANDEKTHSFSEFLEYTGKIPIPPYLKREADASDDIRYQTIFAKDEGSVAAPTASLHFTDYILEEFQKRNIDMEHLTLHVGAGTFMPVKSEKIGEHKMHSEWIEIPLSLLEKVRNQIIRKEKIIAIGTTSTRTIESVYWIGVQILEKQWNKVKEHGIAVAQWYPYEEDKDYSSLEAIEAIIAYFKANNISNLITKTQLIIAPGYEFKMIDGLITNFHQPSSTLLLMISALVGEDWKKIYQYALVNDFRFLSYGDGSLLWR